MKKLTHRTIYTFEGNIWNMLTDPEARYLFLEIRHEKQHQVRFAALDLEHEKLLWKDLTFQEPWWVSMSATDGSTLVLHEYQDSQNPERKQYFAIDVATRQTIWQSDTFQVRQVRQGWLLGYDLQGEERRYKLLAVKDDTEKPLPAGEAAHLWTAENKKIQYPLHYTETQPYFDLIRQFVLRYTDTQPVGGCEYLEYRDIILISYYIRQAKALANYLLMTNKAGDLLLQERLAHHLTHQGWGTFFIAHEKLIIVQEKSQLISYAL